MEKFVGRTIELEALEKRYSRPGSGTCAIYGRRRVGKTTLLNKFCENKQKLYFSGINGSLTSNLESFSKSLSDFTGNIEPVPKTFLDFLDQIKKIPTDKKTVLIFDEYPHLTKTKDGIDSMLQHFIDLVLPNLNIFLIICGSSIRAMRECLENKDKPLFGRFTGPMEIKPLSYKECKNFHPNLSNEENLKLYMIAGGIPLYHKYLDGKSSKEAIINEFFGPYAELRSAAESTVIRELSPSSSYSDILMKIAGGSVRPKEISEKTGISEPLCNRYLKNLEFLDLVEVVTPLGNAPKKPTYRIKDNLLMFHFNVIVPNMSLIQSADPEITYERLKQTIDTFYGFAFENVCSEYVKGKYECRKIGKWWGRVEDEDVDIDLVAIVTDGKIDRTLFGECKFRNAPTTEKTLSTLKNRSEYVKGLTNPNFILFSKSDFSDELSDKDVTLVTLNNLYE